MWIKAPALLWLAGLSLQQEGSLVASAHYAKASQLLCDRELHDFLLGPALQALGLEGSLEFGAERVFPAPTKPLFWRPGLSPSLNLNDLHEKDVYLFSIQLRLRLQLLA